MREPFPSVDSSTGPSAGSSVDPDVDLRVAAERAETLPSPLPVLAAISAGGVAGALGRYGISVALPHDPHAFAWSTFLINVSGCLLIGVLMVLIGDVWGGRRLLRPFLGVGVLGGYTTFSTYVVDVHQSLAAGETGMALAYLVSTLAGALTAVWAGAAATSWAIRACRGGHPEGRS
ncbi:CrcB family protein [Microbispora sp. RL4-1S]|uniref:Fluoride-specific ion channel FluC n=1 Tax=Microbispora oryzae TaxID=2806554 RepID=A0A940WJ48_9ACTN|nr:CrcB family protein [Microbispora oryzae]MBP2706471.1 CrcB family protein [Microbispora oryzae]